MAQNDDGVTSANLGEGAVSDVEDGLRSASTHTGPAAVENTVDESVEVSQLLTASGNIKTDNKLPDRPGDLSLETAADYDGKVPSGPSSGRAWGYFQGARSTWKEIIENTSQDGSFSVEESVNSSFVRKLDEMEKHEAEKAVEQAPEVQMSRGIRCMCCCYGCGRVSKYDEKEHTPRQRVIQEFVLLLKEAGIDDLNVVDFLRGARVMKRMKVTDLVRPLATTASTDVSRHDETFEGSSVASSEGDGLPEFSNSKWESMRRSSNCAPGVGSEDLKKLLRFAKHAQAAYGTTHARPSEFFTELPSNLGNATRAVVLGMMHLKQEDLVELKMERGPCKPAFYIAIDHRLKSVVLCIRGTSDWSDIMTDVAAGRHSFVALHPTPEKRRRLISCTTHLGIYVSARYIVHTASDLLKKAHAKVPDYQMVITGHSLGAGAAAIVTMLLYRHQYFFENKVKCYAFAPPPVVTRPMAEAFYPVITSLVNNNDIVPRLSIVSLATYFEVCKAVRKLPISKRLAIDLGIWSAIRKEDVSLPDLSYLEKHRLYIPGRVFHMKSNQSYNYCTKFLQVLNGWCLGNHRNILDRSYELVERDPDHFWRIKLNGGAILDHSPVLYPAVVARIQTRKQEEEARNDASVAP